MTRNPHLQTAPTGAMDADVDVVMRVAAGDRDAVAELYDRHASRVLGLAYRIVQNSSDAEDVVQEVFSQAWRTAPAYRATRVDPLARLHLYRSVPFPRSLFVIPCCWDSSARKSSISRPGEWLA